MKDLEIILQDYTIVLSEGLEGLGEWLSREPERQHIVIADQTTERLCLPRLTRACPDLSLLTITVPEGEKHKNIDTCKLIWEKMLEFQADRNSMAINLGGGVIGDMGGFAASCYKRGIDFINVPTTVLAQVDASIGGKLGVDLNYGKNLIGLFRNPRRVHISTAFHKTLSTRQYMNGFAEIYKHALIGSRPQWESFCAMEDARDFDAVALLRDSLMIKKEIVEQDPYEKGRRKSLNFGHTIGHAVEAWSLEKSSLPLLHGEAVAAGMIMESCLSARSLGLSGAALEEIAANLGRYYQKVELPEDALDEIWHYMQYDKKNIGNRVMACLIEEIGMPRWDVEITRSDLAYAVAFYNEFAR